MIHFLSSVGRRWRLLTTAAWATQFPCPPASSLPREGGLVASSWEAGERW